MLLQVLEFLLDISLLFICIVIPFLLQHYLGFDYAFLYVGASIFFFVTQIFKKVSEILSELKYSSLGRLSWHENRRTGLPEL